MAKKKRYSGHDTEYAPTIDSAGAGGRRQILIPAEDEPDAYRFTAAIRYGKLSGEVFCKNPERRKELGLPIIFPES